MNWIVNGGCDISSNQLTSLKGGPDGTTTGPFYCRKNQLTNLKYSPQYIGGTADFRENEITDIRHITKSILGNVYLSENEISEKHQLNYLKLINLFVDDYKVYLSMNPIIDDNTTEQYFSLTYRQIKSAKRKTEDLFDMYIGQA